MDSLLLGIVTKLIYTLNWFLYEGFYLSLVSYESLFIPA